MEKSELVLLAMATLDAALSSPSNAMMIWN